MRVPMRQTDMRNPALLSRVLAVAAGLLLAPAGAAAEPPIACAGLEPGPARTVTRVLDGETVVLDDGRLLRLIGALAPRAIDADADPGAWPLEAAAAGALRILVLGKSIELGFAGERSDRYGRVLAQAVLIEPAAGEKGQRWVQAAMLTQGLARSYALAGSRACSAELVAAERGAREARRGLWAEAAYQVRRADKPAELIRNRASFQLVEGTIAGVAQVRDTIYLNFDRNWRQGFSVSLRRDDSGLLGAHASSPKGLEGRTVRVRGWIEQRDAAPVIDLSSGGQIEVVGGADGQPDRAQ
jgi:micrococcal nuclease